VSFLRMTAMHSRAVALIAQRLLTESFLAINISRFVF
jgi:hypothetical protein